MQRWQKRSGILSFLAGNLLVWGLAVLWSGPASAQAPGGGSADKQTQFEKGRVVVGQACAACHTTIVRMIQVHRQSADEWRDTVYFMISRGAQVMPDEIEPVVAYLAATAGKDSPVVPQTAAVAGRGGRGGAGAGPQLPAGAGRAILQQNCQTCHDLATASSKMPSEEWSDVITRMVSYGATVAPKDQETLATYLNGLNK
jgi:mono/diheme cytochrome c family protein